MLMQNEPGAKARWRRWASALAALMIVAIVAAGCAPSAGNDDTDDTADAGPGEPLPAPKATVEITYHKSGDTLVRATVTKFFGAEIIANASGSGGRVASIVRFDGGVPIWEIKADKGFADAISAFGKANYAPQNLEYGKPPAHYEQLIPDEGPPEPLDRGSFYVFMIERASGSTSYQAVKVLADGSLEAYAAQPRAGSSYVMCCNLATDFTEPVVIPEEVTPDESSPDNPDNSGDAPPDSGN
jgi:predicted Rdx family selenoprotein